MDFSLLSVVQNSRIRVILVPVGRIRTSTFKKYAKLIAQFSSISLTEVAPDTKGVTTMFSSQLSAAGHLHFDFVTSHDREHAYLEEFQLQRQIFAVVGIMHCQETSDFSKGYEQFKTLLHKYPSALGQRCFAFEPRDEQIDNVKGVIIIPHVGDLSAYMNTLICDLASTLLGAFGGLAAIIESKTMIASPTPPTGAVVPPAPYGPNDTSSENMNSTSSSLQPGTPVGRERTLSRTPNTTPMPLSPGRLPELPTAVAAPNIPKPPPKAASAASATLSAASSAVSAAGQALVVNPAIAVKAGVDAISVDMRSRKRTPGRTAKLVGDLYLMAGRLNEAISSYNYAILETKAHGDSLWLASALEGLYCSRVLLATEDLERKEESLAPDYTSAAETMKTLLSDGPYQYRDIVQNYERSGFQILSSEACLKVARLITILWQYGYSEKALVSITYYRKSEIDAALRLGPLRLDIAQWAIRAWGEAVDTLSASEQIYIASTIASVVGSIGFRRKQAFFLRQVALLILPMLVQAHINAENVPSSGGISPGSSGVLELLNQLCDIYGVGDPPQIEGGNTDVEEFSRPVLLGDLFGWPDLQITVLRESATICEALSDYPAMIKYTTRLLRRLHAFLPREEQIRLSTSLQRIAAPRANGDETSFPVLRGVWGTSVVTSVEPCRPAARMIPLSERRPIITEATDNASVDPFLYNPYAKKAATVAAVTLVVNEPAIFQVTLQNLFSFDLDIHNITLSTSGIRFVSTPASTTVPANCIVSILVSGIPLEVGKLVIRGCTVKIFGCVEQEFLVMRHAPAERGRYDKEIGRRRENEIPFRRIKKSGLDVLYEQNAKPPQSQKKNVAAKTYLTMRVVEEQPLLKIKSTSLLHGAMMLFEGEQSAMTIQLENISSVPVDHIALTFISNEAATPVKTENMSSEDAYEADLFAARPAIFSWDSDALSQPGVPLGYRKVDLPPGGQYEVTVGVLGKRGCTGGTVHLRYCLLDRSATDLTSNGSGPGETKTTVAEAVFHSRHVSLPILLTIHQGLEPLNMDILLFHSHEKRDQKFRVSKVDEESADECNEPKSARQLSSEEISTMQKASSISGTRKTSISIEQLLLVGGGSYSKSAQRRRAKAEALAEAIASMGILDAESGQRGPRGSPNEYCLFTLDIRNLWNIPFEVSFLVNDSHDLGTVDPSLLIESTALVQPGQTKRIVLPVKRINLPNDVATQPILSLGTKQFVVSKGPKVSEEEERNARILFWYKEHLLRRVVATWECSSLRTGTIDLRKLKVNRAMLKILSTEQISFTVTVQPAEESEGEDHVQRVGAVKYTCQTNVFVNVHFVLTNKQERPVRLCLRIQPIQDNNNGRVDTDLNDRMLWHGSPQRILPEIPPNGTAEFVFPICFISHGRFKILYHAEDMASQTMHYGPEALLIDAKTAYIG